MIAHALDPLQTIVAVASAKGPGLRGIVRISGPNALSVATTGFTPKCGEPPRNPVALFVAGDLQIARVRRSLPVGLALWSGPKTYTGQDLAEIHCTGSPPILDAIVAHCLSLGARAAERGEFTLRAFLNRRIDLTAAEGVLAVVEAQTQAQLDSALKQMAGGAATLIHAARERLLDLLALIEANLDFAHEPDVTSLTYEYVKISLQSEIESFSNLLSAFSGRDRSTLSPRVVLLGPPNAGKSSLFNRLAADADHAIVSPFAGTTRDTLSAAVDCAGTLVELIDTAGLEASNDPIACQAAAHRDQLVASSDLVLRCRSVDTEEMTKSLIDRPVLEVFTKADLQSDRRTGQRMPTSALTGEGLDDLRRAIAQRIAEARDDGNATATISTRARESIARARDCLADSSRAHQAGGSEELVAVDLRSALEELGKIVGAVVTDDILDRIFSRFCIGK